MEMSIYDWILIIAFTIILLFIYGKHKISFFATRGIKSLPAYPFVGNLLEIVKKKDHTINIIHKAYNLFAEEKYIGFYQFQRPILIIKDLEAIKKITIKDFEHFQDHQAFVDETTEPLIGKNIFNLKGQKWHHMRATLSPAFTSSKMKQMFKHVAECGEQIANYFIEKTNKTKDNVFEIEMKDTFTRYTNDVIATAAFGMKIDSLKNRDNEFYKMGKEATVLTTRQFFILILTFFAPKVLKIFKLTLLEKKTANFFRKLVIGQIKYREENNVIRQDMIHLLMEAKKGSLKHDNISEKQDAGFATVEESDLGKKYIKQEWNDDDIIAQAFIFFFAGFDSISTVLCFLTNELAINPEIQNKLQTEVDEIHEKCDGKLTYNDLSQMKYMDMVVSELLRKWPAGAFIDRNCVKPYHLSSAGSHSKPYTIKANEGIWIPTYSIHRDPKYYKNPDKFDPERFSDENKASILPFTYMPFGLGPRNCIGSRFALMEIKSVMFYMLKNFDFVEILKTANPIELAPDMFIMAPKKGFWVGLKRR